MLINDSVMWRKLIDLPNRDTNMCCHVGLYKCIHGRDLEYDINICYCVLYTSALYHTCR